MKPDPRTTYATATRGYDEAFERALVDAITTAIAEASLVSDANVMAIRTGETIAALVTVLAGTIALSPAVTRSPTQLRKFIDETAKRLRQQTMQAAADAAVKEFKARCFHGGDVRGRA